MNEITLILISYKSEKIIYNFIKKIPSKIKTIIVENSQNHELKKSIEQNYKNISVYIKENNGVSSALNFAVEKIETKYFLQISPDIEINFENLEVFLNYAKKLDDRFAALGPRFLNVKEKSHKQIDEKLESGKIDSIHGSCMFINKENFEKIGKFDENFFLYFEETEYCYRAKKKRYIAYQINDIKVKSIGRSVETNNNEEKKLNNILIWHFIWSKYYFSTKKRGKLLSLTIFIPLLLRMNLRIFLYKILKNDIFLEKYKYRLNGLISSMRGKNSDLRPHN
jgi:hypothetical protein